MAYINVYRTTETSLSCRVDGLDSNYGTNDRVCNWYCDGVFHDSVSLAAQITSGGNVTIGGLSPGTTYTVRAHITYNGGEVNLYEEAATDGVSIVRPSDWTWTSSERDAFNNNGSIKALSRTRWNAFLDRVNEFIDYVNVRDGDSISNISSAYYMGSDRLLYASDFTYIVRRMREACGWDLSGITLPVVSGQQIKGSYFTYLANALNDIA